jgi:hypothetical protein
MRDCNRLGMGLRQDTKNEQKFREETSWKTSTTLGDFKIRDRESLQ